MKLNPNQVEELLEDLGLHRENAQKIVDHAPTDNVFIRAANAILAADFFTVLNRFDNSALTRRMQKKPELFFQLINAQCRLAETNLEREKFEWKKQQAQKRRQEREQKLRAKKPILVTSEAIQFAAAAFARNPNESTSKRGIEHPCSSSKNRGSNESEPLQLTAEDIQVMEDAVRMAAEDSEPPQVSRPFSPSLVRRDESGEPDPPNAWLDRRREAEEEVLLCCSSSATAAAEVDA